jgi:hypothetical protein
MVCELLESNLFGGGNRDTFRLTLKVIFSGLKVLELVASAHALDASPLPQRIYPAHHRMETSK